MAPKEMKVRKEDRSVASNYLKKAQDNFSQMQKAFEDENWNATATLAVQCAISAGDAVSVHVQGVRSISQDHMDACELVAKLPLSDAKARSQQLRRVIVRKNMVQYESRCVRKHDADEMIKAVTRFYEWVVVTLEVVP